ncbi:LysE family translocator [Luminiphilus sp.]|nr:LysE family translocator [Luminiphilus sp.]
MSPGPSLAVVMRHSASTGVRAGLACAIAHAFGIFLWAMLMVGGLGALLLAQPAWFDVIRASGALFLMYLGVRALLNNEAEMPTFENGDSAIASYRAAREGLLIALSNPKIAIFFAALFSQFIQPQAPLMKQVAIAVTAAVIDALWYALVSVSVSRAAIVVSHITLLNRLFGAILVALSLAVFWSLWPL